MLSMDELISSLERRIKLKSFLIGRTPIGKPQPLNYIPPHEYPNLTSDRN